MRSLSACLALLLAGIVHTPSNAADPAGAPARAHTAPTEQDVERAIAKLNADPNLATERKARTLRWKAKEKEKEKPRPTTNMPEWLSWIGELFSWLGETARIMMWLAVALLVALLAVWISRFVRERGLGKNPGEAITAPTHVRDLDIRPESLPSDIGAAALELWQRGEHRAALSLLYRGLLSRLAHKFSVPILHSSTEGECGTLAMNHMPPASHEYVISLIRTWQGAVYGGNDPHIGNVQYLCANFAVALDAVSAQPAEELPPPASGASANA